MAREIEIKVLGIDVEKITSDLEKLGAKFEGDFLQRIFTYDLPPISTTFISVRDTLTKNIGAKENRAALQRLISLMKDLADLLYETDKDQLLKLSNTETLDEFIQGMESEIPPAIFDKAFEEIVSRYDTNPNKWVRLRETGDKATLSLKHIFHRKNIEGVRHHLIDAVKEIEIEIDDIVRGRELLEELGLFHKNYQEKRRVSYTLQNKTVKVDIDFWAHIPPYLEIEGDTEESVYATLEGLGLSRDDAKIMNADDVYTFYGLDMYSYRELKLDDDKPAPEMFES